MVKKLIKLLFVLVILVIAGLVAAYIYVDVIAKTAVEKGGTYALGVDTTLDKASVGVFDGQVKLAGLNVANPDGFDTPHFLDLKRGTLEVSLGTLMQETVEVATFKLAGLDVNLQKASGKNNYDVILENLKRFESNEDKTPDDEADGKRFIIKSLVIRDIMVHVDLTPEVGEITRMNLPIDRIALKDVGAENGKGLLLTELAKVVVQAVMQAIVEAGGDILPTELIGDLRSELSGLTDLSTLGIDLESALPDNIDELLGEDGLGGTIGDVLEGAGEGLGGLLGGDEGDDGEGEQP